MGHSNRSFIDRLLDTFVEKSVTSFPEHCFVFPTRRACLIFRNKLADRLKQPVRVPGIISIRDFTALHSGITIADDKELLLELYKVNRKYWTDQTFSKFYSWGQMLLNDFDEIDKQLVSPESIYTGIKEIKKLEIFFSDQEENIQLIKEFSGLFETNSMEGIRKNFAAYWDKLLPVYREFNEQLAVRQIGYEGTAYLRLLEKLNTNTFQSKWQKFHFCGFYGLSAVEEAIISLLQEQEMATLEWDADAYYTRQLPMHEAGNYFRKITAKAPVNLQTQLGNQPMHLKVTGIPMQVGQAKYTGELLNELLLTGNADPDKTVVVLPDEKLLFPLLYALPGNINKVNVTMGMPVRDTVFAQLVQALKELFTGRRTRTDGTFIYYRPSLDKVLSNPLLCHLAANDNAEQTHLNWLGTAQIEILLSRQMTALLNLTENKTAEAAEVLLNIFNEVASTQAVAENKFDKTVCEYLYSEIKELAALLEPFLDELNSTDYWNIVSDVVSILKIPFSGEPVKGLQIMGFLETRALDFENVIILSCNENILPVNSRTKSFIPFSLRSVFGLPTYREQDASSAYHFYRLLHQAKNVHLIYNVENGGISGGEPSRYIWQIEYELCKAAGSKIKFEKNFVYPAMVQHGLPPVPVTKTAGIRSVLLNYTGDTPQRKFSPSALNTYLQCGLKFYYRYIAGLKEPDLPKDAITPDIFGNILHQAMEDLYKPYKGQTITEEIIQSLVGSVNAAVNSAIARHFGIPVDQLQGNDRLLATTLNRLTAKILSADSKTTPFEITGLEDAYTATISTAFGPVTLLGKFDRVDRHNGKVRIIDYKTGNIKIKKLEAVDQLFDDPELSTSFQLFFYELVYRKNFPEVSIVPGFYVAKTLSEGITFTPYLNSETSTLFENLLVVLLEEILSDKNEFTPTSDLARCKYCPYKDLCFR